MIIYLMYVYMLLMFSIIFFLFSLYFLIQKIVIFLEFELIKIISIKVEFLMLLDWVSLLFISVVLVISSMVIVYSIEYMKDDLNKNRFMLMIILFVISMILMIISPNMVSILLGWDGLGLVSYCLVIYYQNENSFNSGMVTVLTNRVGDVMILMLIGLMIMLGSWSFMFFEKMSCYLLIMLMVASFTKSAQIPFSAWLPMAMAAPTPVSSLVHSSTLVTAGVYLLIRFNYLMWDSMILNSMMYISIMTLFMSGLGANFENDLKKIIALSTLSQLGVMIFCLSLMLPEISFFHLLTHAMFKSMLFMCAGVIIHNMLGNQDIRYISMILFNLPLVSMIFNCATFSLCGLPFMSGFYSKDMILELFMMSLINKFMFIMLFISMGFTAMYSIRMVYYSFIKIPNINIFVNYNNLGSLMIYSMFFLFLMSIMMGVLLSWVVFSLKNLIYLTLKFKLMVNFFMMSGVIIGGLSPKIFISINLLKNLMIYIKFFNMMWFISMNYFFWISKLLKNSLNLIFKIDLGWNEYIMGVSMISYLKKIFYMDIFYKNYMYLLIFIMYLLLFLILLNL